MIPRTVSASSLLVAEGCLSRWRATYMGRTTDISNSAADTGTVYHGCLQQMVQDCILDGKMELWTLEHLRALYEFSYIGVFKSFDFETETFKDGWTLAQKWFKRTDLTDREVLSVEQKLTFPVKTSAGIIPCTYIIDRLDKIGPNKYEVVDYKTIRYAPNVKELKRKIQARIYALAIQIQFPDAEEIWVTFDCIRHDPMGSVKFTKEENGQTYRQLQKAIERIIATPDTDVPETLNAECQYCPRKLRCKTLQRNFLNGGFQSITVDEAIKILAQVEYQQKGLEAAQKELGQIITTFAEEKDITNWDLPDGGEVKITVKGSRYLTSTEEVIGVIGFEATKRYGKIGMAEYDHMLKSDEFTDEQKARLKKLIGKSYGNPSVKVIPPPSMDE